MAGQLSAASCLFLLTVFIHQPSADHIESPIGTRLEFNCTVNPGFSQTWRIVLPRIRSDPVFTSDSRRTRLLNNNGIFVEVSPTMSQLVFPGTVAVLAHVRCIAIAKVDDSETMGNEVTVEVYGKLPI